MITKVLEKSHKRERFSCGTDELDRYLKNYASQDTKKKLAVCYVLTGSGDEVMGYYTLSSQRVDLGDIPPALAKSLKYKEIPVIIIGHLAVDNKYQGQRYGESLLIDALNRCVGISTHLGCHAVIVDPIDEMAEKFYTKYGFVHLQESKRMFLPMKTIIDLFS